MRELTKLSALEAMNTIDDYATLIDRLEARASRHPVLYRLQLAALLLLGFGYILFLLLASLVLTVGAVALVILSKGWALKLAKVLWVPVALGYMILKSLWVRIAPPDGRIVKREDAPALFRVIDEARRAQGAQRIHRVVLTDEYNAAVTSVPRLGVLGYHRNYLLLGIPLMGALTPEQFKAVLGHEFGHLAGNHSRFANWIYRTRKTWEQLQAAFEESTQWGAGVVRRFLDWYAPYFNAFSFVLARENEYEADAAAARFTSPETTGAALVAVHAREATVIEPFWEDLRRMVDEQPEPPTDVYTRLLEAPKRAESQAPERVMSNILSAQTGREDTHPSLKDRLAALRVEPPEPAPVHESAAEALLGDALRAICRELDGAWLEEVKEPWRERYHYVQDAMRRLDELENTAHHRALSVDEILERADLTEDVHGGEAAKPLYEDAYRIDPKAANCRLAVGRLRLAEGDVTGVPLLESVIEEYPDAIEPIAELLAKAYQDAGDEGKIQWLIERYQAFEARQAEAAAERRNLTPQDPVEPHGLEEAVLQRWVDTLRRHAHIKKAWLARKWVVHYPESPCYLLLLRFKTFAATRRDVLQELADNITEEGTVIALDDSDRDGYKKLKRRIKRTRGSFILTT